MRKVEILGAPIGDTEAKITWLYDRLVEFAQASGESDVSEIANNYVIDGTFTETRTLDVDTPTAANIAAVLATLISDLRKGGQHRTV